MFSFPFTQVFMLWWLAELKERVIAHLFRVHFSVFLSRSAQGHAIIDTEQEHCKFVVK